MKSLFLMNGEMAIPVSVSFPTRQSQRYCRNSGRLVAEFVDFDLRAGDPSGSLDAIVLACAAIAINARNVYYSTVKRCRDCSQKSRCTRGKYRTLALHTCEPARQRGHALAQTPAFAISQRAGRGGGTDRGPLAGKWCGHSSVVALSFRYLPLSRAGSLI